MYMVHVYANMCECLCVYVQWMGVRCLPGLLPTLFPKTKSLSLKLKLASLTIVAS